MLTIKKLSLLILVISINLEGITFYPSKETLRRITQAILRKEKGAYLRFSDDDVRIASSSNHALSPDEQRIQADIQNALRLNGPYIYKALSYPAKGTLLDQKIPLENIEAACHALMQKAAPFLGGSTVDLNNPALFAYDPLLVLSQSEYDVHYAYRFLKLLKQYTRLFIGYNTIDSHTKDLLLRQNCACILIDPKDIYTQLPYIEQECLTVIHANPYAIITFAIGHPGHACVTRLLNNNYKAFIVDLDDIPDVITQDQNQYGINGQRLEHMLSRDIKVLYTAAILNIHVDLRKSEYFTSIDVLNNYWYEPYIVEACVDRSYLGEKCSNVLYSRVNNPHLRNKGVNEAKSMIQAFNHYQFDDNDMIVKITGRYHFKTDSFLRLIESTPDVDGYVTLDPRTFFSFAGCYALRCKYFKEMLNAIDYGWMERTPIDIERIVLDFMRKIEKERGARILYLDEVDVKSFVNHSWHFEW